MNVILVGFMGSGKTSVGNILAQRLDFEHLDTDDFLEKKYSLPIKKIFDAYGEDFFRNAETEVLKQFLEATAHVVSTGGGIMMKEKNRCYIEQMGLSIFLNTDFDILWERICSSSRPLIKKHDYSKKKIAVLYEQRQEAYKNADVSLNITNDTEEQIAEDIFFLYQKEKRTL